VLDANGNGSFADVAKGILWAADSSKGNASVISMSLGARSGTNDGGVVGQAIQCVEDPTNNHYTHPVFVIAAGNDGNSHSPDYPAAYGGTNQFFPPSPQVLAVAAVCQTGTPHYCPTPGVSPQPYQAATFSNQPWNGVGSATGVAAPGVDINSTWPYGDKDLTSGLPILSDYAVLSGTSMATPFVTAVAALLVAHCGSTESAAQVVARIEASATDLGPPNPDTSFGWGLVNADNAVKGC
jgi:subtilisin family serine protease